MTISQALVLVLVIALWATGNSVNLANNTTLLIILLIALISLVFSTNQNRRRCQNNFQSTQTLNQSLLDFDNFFA